jgi:hypothetical protein
MKGWMWLLLILGIGYYVLKSKKAEASGETLTIFETPPDVGNELSVLKRDNVVEDLVVSPLDQYVTGRYSQRPTGIISGVVFGAQRTPLSGAQVTAGDRLTLTDNSGTFIIDGVPRGVVTVTASAQGYEPYSVDINLTDSASVQFNLRMI